MNVKAYAKVNLGLRVIGRRTDGFHNIETIFYRINLFDELTIIPHQSLSLSCSDPSLPTDNANLCWKAAELLQQTFKTNAGAQIHIEKKIPIGAGLGGGSSDAAAVLKALPKLWGKEIQQSVLINLALQLGSDVPFFLEEQTAYAEGRGEQLTTIAFTIPFWIVLVNPGTHVSTPWAYKALSEKRKGKFPARAKLGNMFSFSPLRYMTAMDNDFEEVVFNKFPVIGEIKRKFLEMNAVHAVMSGSGSSVFGLFHNESDARNAINNFKKDFFTNLTEPNFIPS